MSEIVINIFLLDDTVLPLKISSNSSIQDLLEKALYEVKLQNKYDFALFHYYYKDNSFTLINNKRSDTLLNLSKNLHIPLADSNTNHADVRWFTCPVRLYKHKDCEKYLAKHRIVLMSLNFNNNDQLFQFSGDKVALNLLYLQAKYFVLSSFYSVSISSAYKFAALQIVIQFNNESQNLQNSPNVSCFKGIIVDVIDHFIPVRYILSNENNSKFAEESEEKILSVSKQFLSLTADRAQIVYLETIRNHILFGYFFYKGNCSYNNNPKTKIYIGVSSTSLSIIDRDKDNLPLSSFSKTMAVNSIRSITDWGITGGGLINEKCFYFKVGDKHQYIISTERAENIMSLFKIYLQFVQSEKKDEKQNISFNEEKTFKEIKNIDNTNERKYHHHNHSHHGYHTKSLGSNHNNLYSDDDNFISRESSPLIKDDVGNNSDYNSFDSENEVLYKASRNKNNTKISILPDYCSNAKKSSKVEKLRNEKKSNKNHIVIRDDPVFSLNFQNSANENKKSAYSKKSSISSLQSNITLNGSGSFISQIKKIRQDIVKLEEKKRQNNAAILIQKTWRGHKVRQSILLSLLSHLNSLRSDI